MPLLSNKRNKSEDIAHHIHSELGYDLPDAILITYLLTEDVDIIDMIEDEEEQETLMEVSDKYIVRMCNARDAIRGNRGIVLTKRR